MTLRSCVTVKKHQEFYSYSCFLDKVFNIINFFYQTTNFQGSLRLLSGEFPLEGK